MDEYVSILMLKLLLFLIVGCEICSFASLLPLLLVLFFFGIRFLRYMYSDVLRVIDTRLSRFSKDGRVKGK